MLSVGEHGYLEQAREMDRLKCKVVAAVEEMVGWGLCLVAPPDASVVSMRAAAGGAGSALNIYAVATLMEKSGWNLFTGQHPPCLSICLGENHTDVLEDLLRDLRAAVKTVAENPGQVKVGGNAGVYGAASALPDELLESVLCAYNDIRLQVKAAK
jgi:hypothetical protein